jgi:hypothetical protein
VPVDGPEELASAVYGGVELDLLPLGHLRCSLPRARGQSSRGVQRRGGGRIILPSSPRLPSDG